MQMAVAKRTLAEPWALGTNVFDRDMLFFSGPVPSPPWWLLPLRLTASGALGAVRGVRYP